MMNLITNNLLKNSKQVFRHFKLTLREIIFEDDWDESLEELIRSNKRKRHSYKKLLSHTINRVSPIKKDFDRFFNFLKHLDDKRVEITINSDFVSYFFNFKSDASHTAIILGFNCYCPTISFLQHKIFRFLLQKLFAIRNNRVLLIESF